MPDVSIDYAAIAASKTAYKNMRSMLEGATRSLSDVSGSAVAQSDLRGKLEDLHGSWGRGAKKLAEYAEDAGAGLEGILEAFQGLDSELGASMTGEGGKSA
ncbi:hypothetical protein [Microbacterium sp. C7(2022)]|uniref:hypothetical protein n=1 Tax=Microbacterium sp. C7(2022) TaxID=2992759 RepID=UPI00237B0FE5|nr:hypothetical protein [Microbacterium sp. C7(2022)]MDE0547484.1 hypothetical protein [Microbacterium sp. C7(2022)]